MGDSGLPVFQAGHCSWQRPHSVQVEKSSRPFQVKSSIRPTPRRTSSGRVSRAAKSTGAPPARTGGTGPSAGPPSTSRWAQTLTIARNRCQETPIAGWALVSPNGSTSIATMAHFPLTAWLGERFAGLPTATLETAVVVTALVKILISMTWMAVVGARPAMGVSWHRFLAIVNVWARREVDGSPALGPRR